MRLTSALFTTLLVLSADCTAATQQVTRSARPLAPQAPAAPRPTPCSPRFLRTPTFSSEVMLPWQACPASAWPFTAVYSPDGADLYLPLFGGLIGSGGCTVARVDPVTFQLRSTITVEESPEDVDFVTRPDGSVLLGFVSNSSASSVTVFDSLDRLVTTIPLPPDPQGSFPTAFPFDVITSPDQSTVYVGTLDGQGLVHAIDVATLALDPVKTIALGTGVSAARMAFVGEELVICATEFLPGFTGSTGKVVVVPTSLPGPARELVLASDSSGFLFPNPQDVAIDCEGLAWVAGFDMGARVFAIDPVGPTLVTTIATATSQPDGKFQALGLSDEGLLAVSDFWTNEMSTIDVRRRAWRETIGFDLLPVFARAAQDIVFSPDGLSIVVPCAASDNVIVFAR
ncbi:MAG: hypothetical protein AAF726_18635 [Planctomycetota bacterium]